MSMNMSRRWRRRNEDGGTGMEVGRDGKGEAMRRSKQNLPADGEIGVELGGLHCTINILKTKPTIHSLYF